MGDFFNTGRGEIEKFSDTTIDELVRACFAMGRLKTGALIVMEDEINLGEYIRTGIDVDAKMCIRDRLVGVAYILDEPSIGLHQRDNDKLLGALMNLKNLGNTLIVVEHDERCV